jgi:hypothetical protein
VTYLAIATILADLIALIAVRDSIKKFSDRNEVLATIFATSPFVFPIILGIAVLLGL